VDTTKQGPTISGSHPAYRAEFYDDGEWRSVPVVKDRNGLPSPLCHGHINGAIGLFGREQALAFAWSYAACVAADGGLAKVRVVEYAIQYDIEAKEITHHVLSLHFDAPAASGEE